MSGKRIEDYALIGDGETAALVHRNGSIEWLCFPRFDSEACFAALLGDRENGCWTISLRGKQQEISRRYLEDSLILETTMTCDTGTLRLIDFMPIRGEAPDIVRIAECTQGRIELTSELILRFDYGRIHPLIRTVSEERSTAISGPDAVSLDFDAPIEFADRRFTSHVRLEQGERSSFVLTWFPSYESAPDRVDPLKSLEDTRQFWADWTGCVSCHVSYRPAVVRSLITLKALIHTRTGGMVAAPTASLPESPGGSRNWDYRYCWLRDATFVLLALLRSNLLAEAKAWIEWLRRAVGGDPIEVRPFYAVDGDNRRLEWEAAWLAGFNGAKPIRFGNQAETQLQLDIFGEVIDALYQAKEKGIDAEADSEALVRMLADKLAEVWREPDAGIWESRGKARQHTYSKVMCWVAFDRAAGWLATSDPDTSRRYSQLADEVRAEVLDKGFDTSRNAFVGAFGGTALDAAALRIPLVGFLPADDWRMISTVAAIEHELCSNGLVRRYIPSETYDGLDGEEGAMIAANFWLADVYFLQGREHEARALFEMVLGRANDLGLLAEELSVHGEGQLGNFPQALSHLSLVSSADRLTGGSGSERRPAQ